MDQLNCAHKLAQNCNFQWLNYGYYRFNYYEVRIGFQISDEFIWVHFLDYTFFNADIVP